MKDIENTLTFQYQDYKKYQIELIWTDEEWVDYYLIGGTNIIDSAVWLEKR